MHSREHDFLLQSHGFDVYVSGVYLEFNFITQLHMVQ